jgi:hypothetical protein
VQVYLVLLLALATGVSRGAADAGQAKPDSNFFFMSGVVTDLQENHLTITRTPAGKAAEKHTFVTTPETTIEGKLRLKARVTVGYVKGETEDTAVRIIVRPASPPSKKQ